MLSKNKLQQSIREIYSIFLKRNVGRAFTLESIQDIFEIGNEVFQKNNPEELEKFKNRHASQAPDILDDEPFSLERTLEIYERLQHKYTDVSPDLIKNIFEINSKLAWQAYRRKYDDYLLGIYRDYPEDEYINYLTAVVFYDNNNFEEALHCINRAIINNDSSANFIHIKGLCLMQLGEFEAARTYLYQALFLVELMKDVPPRARENRIVYPNYPIEFHSSANMIRADLRRIDQAEKLYRHDLLPLTL